MMLHELSKWCGIDVAVIEKIDFIEHNIQTTQF